MVVRAILERSARRQHYQVYVMRADGTDLRPLSRTINWEDSPDWGPRQ